MLELQGLSKRFGGLVATNEVSLKIEEGTVHALIGPNGAGKTTLIGQISGAISPDAGRILFSGEDLTRKSEHQRVAAGLARSFQITSLFRPLSVLDNLALAVQARSGSSFSFWKPVAAECALFDEARALLRDIGLEAREAAAAGTLAHGEQRALEVGLALATRPRLLLLDEPMAGMGPEESGRMVELIERLRARVTLLLVEHDMDAVFRLAGRISVLVDGRIVATGSAEQIRANEDVPRAYLGDDVAA